MTCVIPTGKQRAFLPENCDNTGGEKALKNQASSDANYQNTEVLGKSAVGLGIQRRIKHGLLSAC